jgi:hypothetical protein
MRCWAVDAAGGGLVPGCRGWWRVAVAWFQCRDRCFQPGQDALGGGLRLPRAGRKNEQREWQLARGTPFPSVVSGVSNHRHQRKGNGVRSSRLWGILLGCENTVIEDVDWCEEDSGDGRGPALRLIVRVRPHKRLAHRCGICGEKRPRYDNGQGRRITAIIGVICMALLIYSLIERQARRNLAPATRLDGLYAGRPAKPTARLILTTLATLRLRAGTGDRPPQIPQPDPVQQQLLDLLEIDPRKLADSPDLMCELRV